MKKAITIIVIFLAVVGGGYFLFKISPAENQVSQTGYNGAIKQNTNLASMSTPPAFDPNIDHYVGNPQAKNVFIEYGDMQCPYCAQYNPMLKQVASQFPDTVFVFRYFPLLNHKNTVEASLAAEAAGAQGKFWEMHDLLFTKQTEWENASEPLDIFTQYAQQVGVQNIEQFKNDIVGKKYLDPMQKGEDEAYALNLGGTPSYFFNGHPLQTIANPTIEDLKKQAEPYFQK